MLLALLLGPEIKRDGDHVHVYPDLPLTKKASVCKLIKELLIIEEVFWTLFKSDFVFRVDYYLCKSTMALHRCNHYTAVRCVHSVS